MLEISPERLLPQHLLGQTEPAPELLGEWAATGEEHLQRQLLLTTYPSIRPEELQNVAPQTVERCLATLLAEYATATQPIVKAVGHLCLMHEHLNGRSDAELTELIPTGSAKNVRMVRYRMRKQFIAHHPDVTGLITLDPAMAEEETPLSERFQDLSARYPSKPCVRHPGIYLEGTHDATEDQAALLCRSNCPPEMARACLVEAFEHPNSVGVWGGTTEEWRERFKREHPGHPLVRRQQSA